MNGPASVYIVRRAYILLSSMAKHLVDIDEPALRAAKATLGTATIKETVNRALAQVSGEHGATVRESLDVLADADLAPREQAWR
jgi:Arc/MetJ family transcription regulator